MVLIFLLSLLVVLWDPIRFSNCSLLSISEAVYCWPDSPLLNEATELKVIFADLLTFCLYETLALWLNPLFWKSVLANLRIVPDGKKVFVEFFDYNCPHCREMNDVMKKLVSEDKDVKVIYKLWPMFGKDSLYAARAAMAAKNQGKFVRTEWRIFWDFKAFIN